MPGSRTAAFSPAPRELECLVLETVLSKEWDQPWPWSAEPCCPLSAPRGHSAPTVNPHSLPAMHTHHSQLPWRDRQEMFIEQEVKLDLPANRTLTHELATGNRSGTWARGGKAAPTGAQGLASRPSARPAGGTHGSEWRAAPRGHLGAPALQGHRGPQNPRETHHEAGVPCAHPSPGPHPHHPCPRGQNKT